MPAQFLLPISLSRHPLHSYAESSFTSETSRLPKDIIHIKNNSSVLETSEETMADLLVYVTATSMRSSLQECPEWSPSLREIKPIVVEADGFQSTACDSSLQKTSQDCFTGTYDSSTPANYKKRWWLMKAEYWRAFTLMPEGLEVVLSFNVCFEHGEPMPSHLILNFIRQLIQ